MYKQFIIYVFLIVGIVACSSDEQAQKQKVCGDTISKIVELTEDKSETWTFAFEYGSSSKRIAHFKHKSGVEISQIRRKKWSSDPWSTETPELWIITKPKIIILDDTESNIIHKAYEEWDFEEVKKNKCEVYDLLTSTK